MVENESAAKVESESEQKKADSETTPPDATEEEPTELEGKIIRQLEYYFGDANLVRDKFLRAQIEENEGGWVTLDVLLTFKRLAALSKDKKVIADAISKSDTGLIEVSEDREKLRRHPEHPLPEQNEEYRKEIMSRTVYTKGFPLDADMTDLLNFYADFEKVVNITMRKYLHKPTKTHKFKGSVFVTFATAEQAKEYFEKENVQYNDRPLLKKMQQDYLEEKRAEIQKKKAKKEVKPPEPEPFQLPKGSVIKFEDGGEGLSRELIRGAIEKVADDIMIAFIEFNKGDTNGRIRFDKEGGAQEFLERLKDNKMPVTDEITLTLNALSESEEKVFLQKACEDMKNRRRAARAGRKRRGGVGGNFNKNEKKAKAE